LEKLVRTEELPGRGTKTRKENLKTEKKPGNE
jgi:hypothetical protein